mgnify:CR=1 FL=1
MLKGFILTTLNKLPNIKADLVRMDDEWEKWEMEQLLEALQKWLKRNQPESVRETSEKRKERHWYSQGGGGRVFQQKGERKPFCIFGCEEAHWGDSCPVYETTDKRRNFFADNKLCFGCGKRGHRGENKCNEGDV